MLSLNKAKNPPINRAQTVLKKLSNYLILVILVIFTTSLAHSINRIVKINDQIKAGEEKVEKIKRENEELDKKLIEVQSEEFIEKQLRDKLDLAKTGEIVVILPEEDVVRSLAPREENEEETLPDPNWKKWAHLFGF